MARKLSGSDPEPLRHQVWELPEIKPLVTEYQRHRLTCPACGETTCAELPPGVPQGQSGPRLMAFTALLMAYYRQSKRRTAEFLSTLLGQPCCPALTVKMQTQVTAAVRPAYEELAAQLPTQDQVNADETPTKEENGKAWLWTFVARMFTVFAVRPTREATAVDELLTAAFRGVVTCDRAKMYWRVGRLQWCWAHLKRDFQALIDSGDNQAKRLGYDLRRMTCKLFEHWANYRDGTISRAAFVRRMAPVRREVERLLLRGVRERQCVAGRHVPGIARASGLALDVRPLRRRRTDEQCGRTCVASRRHLAQALLRHAKCQRQPLRGNDADRDRDLPPTTPQRLRVPHRRRPFASRPPTHPVTPSRGVNGCRRFSALV